MWWGNRIVRSWFCKAPRKNCVLLLESSGHVLSVFGCSTVSSVFAFLRNLCVFLRNSSPLTYFQVVHAMTSVAFALSVLRSQRVNYSY